VSRALQKGAMTMRTILCVACAVAVNLGCASAVKLHDGAGLTEANLVKLRVSGAMTLSRAVVVRRVDDEWGRNGGAVGSYFNDQSSWGAKVDLPAGRHQIEATYKEIVGVTFEAELEANRTYGIEPVDGKPACLKLVDDRDHVVQEQCYTPTPASTCSSGEARVVFSQAEAKAASGKDTWIYLQKIDDTYGPNSASLGWGLNFFNDKSSRDLDVRVCAGEHRLVFGVDIEGYKSMRPLALTPRLEANTTYRAGVIDSGIEKKTFLFTTPSLDIKQVLFFLEKVDK
jgi:hypothetical protein